MKNSELRFCDKCAGPLNGGDNSPMLGALVTFQRLVLDVGVARKSAAMHTMFPTAPHVAEAFCTGEYAIEHEDMRTTVLLCEKCILVPIMPMSIIEIAEAKRPIEPSAPTQP